MTSRVQTKAVKKTLHDVFGFDKLRPNQAEVIRRVLNGENTLAIMPTGAGKSLCYQLPALEMPGMTIVVSPLISLMKDQVDKLTQIGVETAQLNSAISQTEQTESLDRIEHETNEFIFVTPERLSSEEFLQTLDDKNIDLFVIDEAHCISEWGHDFRPAFLNLRTAIERLGNPVVLALTATATDEVVEDIKKQLDLPKMSIINAGIFRPNLKFEVFNTTNETEKKQRLTEILRAITGSKIIYCATVKAVEEVSEFLKQFGFTVEPYHGKLSAKIRRETQDKFISGELETIIATNAFGMGIDKPDVRAVVHWQIPGNLEAYYQEAGRAGRDDEPARCVLLYDVQDRRTQAFFLGGKYPKADDVLATCQALETLKANESAVKLNQIEETVADAVAKNKIRVALNLLKDERIVKELRGAKFKLLKTDLTGDEIARFARAYEERGEKDREKLERIMQYAGGAFCRWRVLREYFEAETADENCGACDNCVQPIEKRLQIEPETKTHFVSRTAAEKIVETIRKEMNRDDFKIKTGDIVTLPAHGEAEVRSVADDKIEVVLINGETKIFKKEFVEEVARKTSKRTSASNRL